MTNQQPYRRHGGNCVQRLLFIVCSCSAIYLPAQPSAIAQPPAIKYVHFTRNNFLVTNQVNWIMQDSKHFIWLATSNGIQRFDGNRWLWLSREKNSATSLPDNDVSSILEDSRRRLWVRTATGICLLNPNSLEFSPVAVSWSSARSTQDIQTMLALPDGRVWLTQAAGGLYYFDEGKEKFVPGDSIIPGSGSRFNQIAYDSGRRIYYLGSDSGIVIYNRDKRQFCSATTNPKALSLFKVPSARQPIASLYLNHLGQLWFSNYNVHSCYDINKDSLIFCDSTSKVWGVVGFTTDRSGTTWSYGAGLSQMNFSTGRIEPIRQTGDQLYGISFQNGGCLMEDSENTYWIATNNGVFLYNRLQQQFFQHSIKSYATGQPFTHINVWGFIELADSSVAALTTRGEGLYFFDKNLQQIPSGFNLAPYVNANAKVNIRCGLKDNEDHLWIACERGTLLKLYPGTGRVEKIDDTTFSRLGIYSMTRDNAGNLYLGTFRGTIIRRDAMTGRFTPIFRPPESQNGFDNIFCLSYDGNKYIWAASGKSGLLKINTQTAAVEKTYIAAARNDSSLPGPRIYAVTIGAYNQLVMATPAGLVIMDIAKENFRLLTTADGLPDDNVSALLKGPDRKIWFASDNGISATQPGDLTTRSYGTLNGLSNESFNIGACMQLRDGRLLFGHNEGFTSLDPAALSPIAPSPTVQITGIRLFDKYLNTDSILNKKGGMVLQYSQNFLSIEFSNMSVLNKDHSSYFYQLEGVDKDWIRSSGMPQAVYTYLPGGTYTFRVKSSTGGRTGAEQITAFTITIIPPLWKAWWFYLVAAAVISGLVYVFFRSQYQQRLEAEKGRNRIAKDLHDDMGSSLTLITILSEMAKTKIDIDIPTTRKFIYQISDNSNRIMESLDDIVWNIDKANDNMEDTLSRMREFAGNLLEARNISYSFKEDEKIKHVHLDLGRRHDFFMIFKEAVINLAKYSHCNTVRLELTVQKNMLRLMIADDGVGFDQQNQVEGNGLGNMPQRAASLKGTLTIESNIDKGTVIVLAIPV